MRESSVTAFEERLGGMDCSDTLRRIVASLRAVAEEDDSREWTSIAGDRGSWWGMRYKRGRSVYLRIDPKPVAGHVCVCVPGAEDEPLKAAGQVHRRKNDWPWVDVKDVRGAEVLADEIRQAYRRVG
jgi:hypothetical protein